MENENENKTSQQVLKDAYKVLERVAKEHPELSAEALAAMGKFIKSDENDGDSSPDNQVLSAMERARGKLAAKSGSETAAPKMPAVPRRQGKNMGGQDM